MPKPISNLCAKIPLDLHQKIRTCQKASGKTLSEYMTWMITSFYEMEGKTPMNTDTRTVAFQIPAELFEQFKDYLQRHNIRQKDFFLDCIQRALTDDSDSDEPTELSQGDGSDKPEAPADGQWRE